MNSQISNVKASFKFNIELATSIYEFVTSQGKRRLKQPYWVVRINSDGPEGKPVRDFDFEYINESTDLEQLKSGIEEKVLWIQPLYKKLARENFPDKFKETAKA